MMKYSKWVSFTYKVTRTAAASLYYLRRDAENHETFKAYHNGFAKHDLLDADFFRRYRKKWLPWSASFFLSRSELETYCLVSGLKTLDYMPLNIYFTSIDPVLNNKQMEWGYAEKGNYRKLYDIDNEPLSLLRFLNGLAYDFGGHLVLDPANFLVDVLKSRKKILVKPVVETWGGRNVLVFEKQKSENWKCINGETELSLKGLKGFYSSNFVVQEYLEQHPFYSRFNVSSFNTLRIYVYRSPSDEQVHVLHSVLKVGKSGNVVDNIGAGGTAFYVKPDGTIMPGISKKLEKIEFVPGDPGTAISEIGKAPGIDAIKHLAVKVAFKTPFHRVLALDVNIDVTNKPRLVELNLSEAGNKVQLFGYPFFGSFTREVIDYCSHHKRMDFLRI